MNARIVRPDTAAGIGLCAAAAAAPMLGIFAPLGLAPVGIVTALACLPSALHGNRWRRLPPMVVLFPLLLALWAAVSAWWALDVREALGGAGKQALSTIGGIVILVAAGNLDGYWRRRIGWVLLGALLIAGTVLAVEYVTDRGISTFIGTLKGQVRGGAKSALNRGATVVSLLVWPALLLIGGCGPRRFIPVLLAVLAAMFLGDSLSTRAAIAASIAAALLVAMLPRAGLAVIAAALALLMAVAPWAAGRIPDPHYTFQNWTWLPMSSHHRMTIWGFTGQRIAEKPILGWGMEASRVMPDADVEVQVWRYAADGSRTNLGLLEAQLPLHPHNAVLQVWLELGAPGALVLLAALLAVLAAIDRRPAGDRLGRAAAAGSFAGALVIATVSFGFWQSWWQSTLWLTAAFVVVGLAATAKNLPDMQTDRKNIRPSVSG